MILIRHRKFAIRPRLAYFRRVRSPQPAEGCIRPHGEFSWVGTCAECAHDPRGRHVVVKDHPTLPEGSVHFGKRQPSRGWVSTKGKGEGMRVWHNPSKLRTKMFDLQQQIFHTRRNTEKYVCLYTYYIHLCSYIEYQHIYWFIIRQLFFVGKFCNMSIWKYLYLPKIIIKIFYTTDETSHDQIKSISQANVRT